MEATRLPMIPHFLIFVQTELTDSADKIFVIRRRISLALVDRVVDTVCRTVSGRVQVRRTGWDADGGRKMSITELNRWRGSC